GPTTTGPGLTKPRNGALDLRSGFKDRINFVRLATADDIQGPASASFAFHDLGARRALVIDDAGDGRDIAAAFQQAFTSLAGTAATGSYMSQVTIAPMKADFAGRYRTAFGTDADEFAAAAYACAEVILDALREVAKTGPGAGQVREDVRAWATDPGHR